MPKCKVYISGCTTTVKNNGDFCDKCRLKKQGDETLKRQKEQVAKENEKRQLEMKALEEKAKKTQEAAEKKKQKITEVAGTWNRQINDLVEAVKRLRAANTSKGTGINAGKNHDVKVPTNTASMTVVTNNGVSTVTIVGGSGNELPLTLPSDASSLGITKGDVAKAIAGHDTSWSAGHKYIRGDKIFIHCK